MFSIVSLTQNVSSKEIEEKKKKPDIILKRNKVKIINKQTQTHKINLRVNND